ASSITGDIIIYGKGLSFMSFSSPVSVNGNTEAAHQQKSTYPDHRYERFFLGHKQYPLLLHFLVNPANCKLYLARFGIHAAELHGSISGAREPGGRSIRPIFSILLVDRKQRIYRD